MKKYVLFFLVVFYVLFININDVNAICSATTPWECEGGVYNGPSTGSSSTSGEGGSSCIDNCNKSAACTTGDRQQCSACRSQCQVEANEEKEKDEAKKEEELNFGSNATSNADDATSATNEKKEDQDSYYRDIIESQSCCYDYFDVGTADFSNCIKYATANTNYCKNYSDNINGNIIDSILSWGSPGSSNNYDGSFKDPCALIDGDIQKILHKIFFGISIAGIIILVVMTAISLVKVITASEDEALKNFFKGLWKRLICLIILLLLPMIVTFIIQLVNNVAPSLGIKSDNPLCNITE